MKAAVIEKPNVLVVRDVPEPVCGEYDALCQLEYGTTCTGTDMHIIAGRFPPDLRFPTILGHESAGRVISVGRKVRSFRVADLITRVGTTPAADGSIDVTWGGFAQRGIARDHFAMAADGLPPQQWRGHRWNQVVHPAIDPRIAPMFTTWRETLSYCLRMGVGRGARVLVIGSGGVGLAFAAHAVLLGAARVAMVGADYSRDKARRVGVCEFLDYRSPQLAKNARDACPDGFEFIIDAVGKKTTPDLALPLLAAGGRLGIYGIDDRGEIHIDASRAREPFTVFPCSYDEAETHQQVCDLVLAGRLDAGVWYDVEHPYPLSEIAQAFDDLRQRKIVKAFVNLV